MTTKEVFDLYFKDMPSEKTKKCRGQVDRPEVYAYEEKLGKQIFDMNADELIGLILSFHNNNRKNDKTGRLGISYTSIELIASLYRSIWNYYIENIEIIKNPWNTKGMRGMAFMKRLTELKPKFTYDVVEKAIEDLYNQYPDDNYTPKYVECLLLLFYNGFANPQEIVLLKEDMINFKMHEVRLTGRTVHLSDRCFELLQYVHNLDKIVTPRGLYKVISYHDGYFKFVVRENGVKLLQNKTSVEVGNILTNKIKRYLGENSDFNISYRTVYLLGFFDFIVKRTDENRARKLVTSVRNSEKNKELMRYASEYGVVADNVTYIKKCLRQFI